MFLHIAANRCTSKVKFKEETCTRLYQTGAGFSLYSIFAKICNARCMLSTYTSGPRGQKLSRVADFSSRSGNTRVAGVTPFWVYIIIHQYGVRPTRGRATKKLSC